MATDEKVWKEDVGDFRDKYEFLLEARDKMKQPKERTGVIVKPQGQRCEYNYECESECCLRFKRRGPRRGNRRGGGGDAPEKGSDRLLRRLLQEEKIAQGILEEEEDERFAGKVCTMESRCDDDVSDTLYSIWNFMAGLLIGGLCICVCLQRKYFQMRRASATTSA